MVDCFGRYALRMNGCLFCSYRLGMTRVPVSGVMQPVTGHYQTDLQHLVDHSSKAKCTRKASELYGVRFIKISLEKTIT